MFESQPRGRVAKCSKGKQGNPSHHDVEMTFISRRFDVTHTANTARQRALTPLYSPLFRSPEDHARLPHIRLPQNDHLCFDLSSRLHFSPHKLCPDGVPRVWSRRLAIVKRTSKGPFSLESIEGCRIDQPEFDQFGCSLLPFWDAPLRARSRIKIEKTRQHQDYLCEEQGAQPSSAFVSSPSITSLHCGVRCSILGQLGILIPRVSAREAEK